MVATVAVAAPDVLWFKLAMVLENGELVKLTTAPETQAGELKPVNVPDQEALPGVKAGDVVPLLKPLKALATSAAETLPDAVKVNPAMVTVSPATKLLNVTLVF